MTKFWHHWYMLLSVGNNFLLQTNSETGGTCTYISQTGNDTLNTRNTGNKNSLKISTSTVVFSLNCLEFCISMLLESMSTNMWTRESCWHIYHLVQVCISRWTYWQVHDLNETYALPKIPQWSFFFLFQSLTLSLSLSLYTCRVKTYIIQSREYSL